MTSTDSPKSKRPSAADPYSKLAKDVNSRSNLVPVVIGVIAVALVVVALIAFLSSRSSTETVEAGSGAAAAQSAKQETGVVQISGQDLSPYPDQPSGLLTDPATDPAVGEIIPTLSGQSFDETPITIGPDAGKPQVIIFVAHWCPHCQKEVPLIQEWIDSGKAPEGVLFSTVSTGVSSSKPNYPPSKWLAGEGWQPQVLLDDAGGSASQAFGLPGFPYFVMTDAQGKVVQRGSGEVPIDQFETAVNALVADSAASQGTTPPPPS